MSHKTKHVTVIGGTNVDITARYLSELKMTADSFQGEVSTSAGGVARNVAENLARLGCQTTLISAIGDNDLSSPIMASINIPNLDTSACYFPSQTSSDTYLSLFDHHGELLHAINQMTLIDQLTPDYLSRVDDKIHTADLLVADCNLPAESIDWLMQLPNRPKLYVDGVSSEKIMKLRGNLHRLDGLKCNRKEAAAITGKAETAEDADLMSCLLDHGIRTVILSVGSDGIVFHHEGDQIHAPSIKMAEDIISVSGAGDALFAGYIAGALSGRNNEEALNLGIRAASLSLLCAGAVNPDVSSIIEPGSG